MIIGRHKRVQFLITFAIGLVMIAQVIVDKYYPDAVHLTPLAGFGANLIWIWVEEV